jgi:phage terminase large subunit
MIKISPDLSKKQKQAFRYLLDKETTEILFGGGAGGGKSYLGCLWLITMSIQYPGSRWLMGRSKLTALKQTTLNTFFDVCQQFGIKGNGVHYSYNQVNNTIKWFNGSEILLKDLFRYPSDPNFDSLGSLEITGAFIDECNQLTEKAKQIVASRIRYKLDEYGLIPKIIMTCNPAKNWVYDEFYKKNKDSRLEVHKKFIQALVTDNPHISEHYVNQLHKLDKSSKMRLLFGQWEYDDDPSVLILFDAISDLFNNDYLLPGTEEERKKLQKYISADIARFGDDKTVIFLWQGYAATQIHVLFKKSIKESTEYIKNLAREQQIPNSKIVVDSDGVGGGVVDYIPGCYSFVAQSKPIPVDGKTDNYSNLKSQCYFKLAELINQGQLYVRCEDIDVKEKLTEELEQVKRKDFDKDGPLKIVPKEEVKAVLGRSPDFSDTMAMRMVFEFRKTGMDSVDFCFF